MADNIKIIGRISSYKYHILLLSLFVSLLLFHIFLTIRVHVSFPETAPHLFPELMKISLMMMWPQLSTYQSENLFSDWELRPLYVLNIGRT